MPKSLDEAIAALNDGKLVHLPTETVYGLAARADNAAAVLKVYEAKGRPSFNPLIVHVGSLELAQTIGDFSARALIAAKEFWPGPLTLVVPIKDAQMACDLARAGLDSVALRMPSHPVALAILKGVPFGVVAPSANRSGRPSPTTQMAAFEETGDAVAVSVDGGACDIGLESTVISFMDGLHYLRDGKISRAEIETALGPISDYTDQANRSPGRLSRHYAPETPVLINVTEPPKDCVYLSFGPTDFEGDIITLSATKNIDEAARNLFAALRAADALQPSIIAVAPIPDIGFGVAINDRLRRAAGFIG